jgi:hypothetical protein
MKNSAHLNEPRSTLAAMAGNWDAWCTTLDQVD